MVREETAWVIGMSVLYLWQVYGQISLSALLAAFCVLCKDGCKGNEGICSFD